LLFFPRPRFLPFFESFHRSSLVHASIFLRRVTVQPFRKQSRQISFHSPLLSTISISL
jgi:hypothetical protein